MLRQLVITSSKSAFKIVSPRPIEEVKQFKASSFRSEKPIFFKRFERCSVDENNELVFEVKQGSSKFLIHQSCLAESYADALSFITGEPSEIRGNTNTGRSQQHVKPIRTNSMRALELISVGSADTSKKRDPGARREPVGNVLYEFKWLLPGPTNNPSMLAKQNTMIEGFKTWIQT